MDTALSFAAALTKGVNTAARTVEAIVSDETIDRMGDVIDCASWQLDRYRSNPVVLFQHNHREPIGRTDKVWIEGTQLHARIVFAKTPRGDEVLQLFGERALRAFSVGFRVGHVKQEVIAGREVSRLLACELHEISAVSVPANPSALVKAKSLGLVPSSYEYDGSAELAEEAMRVFERSPVDARASVDDLFDYYACDTKVSCESVATERATENDCNAALADEVIRAVVSAQKGGHL